MKTTLQTLALASVFALASCGEEQAPEAVTAPAEPIKKDSVTTAPKLDTFTVQTDLSSVNWMGSSPVKGHKGMLKLSQGWLGFNAGKIAQGAFTIDMKSITNSDLKDKGNNKKLVDHLSGKDFFKTDSFPTAEFILTSATDSTLTGNLTIKGIANSVTFPYKVFPAGNDSTFIAHSKFSIDRSKWGIEYGGKSVAGIKPNDIISDMIELSISLNAKKK